MTASRWGTRPWLGCQVRKREPVMLVPFTTPSPGIFRPFSIWSKSGAFPPARVTFHGWHPSSLEEGLKRNRGIVATAMHCVNSVPYVCAAEPGIRTTVDLPQVIAAGAKRVVIVSGLLQSDDPAGYARRAKHLLEQIGDS